jgi:hypothetical protein
VDRGGAGALSAIDSIRAHLDRGAPWDACDAFREAAAAGPDDPALLYWGALAHARAGAALVAHALLDRCDAASLPPSLRVEACSLRGRLWKDAWDRAYPRADASPLLAKARAQYVAAHGVAGDAYPAINAASLAMLAGDRADAIALARVALERVRGQANASTWDVATRAEAELLTGDIAAASASYAEACSRAEANAGVVASMRRQLRLLARALPAAEALRAELPAPDVVAFAGHLVDAPDRGTPRFPPSLAPGVREALASRLSAMREPVVFASAACGAALLFVDAALARGAEVNVVLPDARDDFVRTSGAPGGGEWARRFDDALARATRVIMATEEQHLGDDSLFDDAARLVEGFSRLRAAQLETAPSMLCVLDPDSDGRVGGTRASYERWKASGDRLDVIDLAALRGSTAAPRAGAGDRPVRDAGGADGRTTVPSASGARTWKALLFADFVGFSRVQDAFAPRFHERFLDIAAREMTKSSARPLDAKTWGDGLYAVFDAAPEAAEFAWRFLEATHGADWSDAGMTATAGVRIALHAGPVYRGYDPVMRRDDFFGSSVTRAARIEPVTQPGTIYASEAFAATLAARPGHPFALEYIGRTALAKGYGETRIYRVDRAQTDTGDGGFLG